MFIFGISFLLISCTNDTTKVYTPSETSIQNPMIFSHNGQEFKINLYDKELFEYVNQAKKQSNNLEELYRNLVSEPFRINAYGENDGYWVLNHWTFNTPTNIGRLEESISSLVENKEEIYHLIKDALKKSSDKLPGGNKTVYVFPANPDNSIGMRQMKGVAGVTMGKEDIILIQIEPSFFEEDILKFTVAHEYHHAVYMENNAVSRLSTLLDTVILEGKADTFAKLIYPEVKAPWTDPLSDESEYEVWKIFKDNINSYDPVIKEEFHNGNLNKGIPQWANYKIGNKILELFLDENTETSIETWTQIPAYEILLKSNYE